MPCRYSDEYTKEESQQMEITRLKKDLDKLTSLLCRAGRQFFKTKELPIDVVEWMQNHCKYDQENGEPWEVIPSMSSNSMAICVINTKIDNILSIIKESNNMIKSSFGNNEVFLAALNEIRTELARLNKFE